MLLPVAEEPAVDEAGFGGWNKRPDDCCATEGTVNENPFEDDVEGAETMELAAPNMLPAWGARVVVDVVVF